MNPINKTSESRTYANASFRKPQNRKLPASYASALADVKVSDMLALWNPFIVTALFPSLCSA